MTPILARRIATITELREPQKVIDAAQGEPVAILKNSKLLGYYVPAERVQAAEHRAATMEEALASLERRRSVNQPVLDWLRDK